jgi:hypothetical protein
VPLTDNEHCPTSVSDLFRVEEMDVEDWSPAIRTLTAAEREKKQQEGVCVRGFEYHPVMCLIPSLPIDCGWVFIPISLSNIVFTSPYIHMFQKKKTSFNLI